MERAPDPFHWWFMAAARTIEWLQWYAQQQDGRAVSGSFQDSPAEPIQTKTEIDGRAAVAERQSAAE
jgi:hypothetical protein